MKKTFLLFATILFATSGCKKNDDSFIKENIVKLEKRIAIIEKQVTALAAVKKPAAAANKEQLKAYDIPVGDSYVMGNTKAPITLVKFSDYQCPFCNRTHDGFIEKIFEDKELKDKVKVVFKHFPLSFHKNARPASKAALAAGIQGHDCFWEMTKKLYDNQRTLTDDNFKKWAGEIKCKKNNGTVSALDVKKFLADYKNKDSEFEKMIKSDMELGMKTAHVRGTPSLFVNGWKLSSRSVDGLKKLIKEKNL